MLLVRLDGHVLELVARLADGLAQLRLVETVA